MVFNDPQNPVAIKREYLVSKFHSKERSENTPKMKLPIILTISTLTGSASANIMGEDTILYRRNAPARAPTDRNTSSSSPLIVIELLLPTIICDSSRHYQHQSDVIECGFGLAFYVHTTANAIATIL